MPDDNIPSQKYRDTGIPWYFVSALANSLSHNCVLMILYVNFWSLDMVVMLLAFMLEL